MHSSPATFSRNLSVCGRPHLFALTCLCHPLCAHHERRMLSPASVPSPAPAASAMTSVGYDAKQPAAADPSLSVTAAASPVDDDGERAVLWLKVSDMRADIARQQRSLVRLRSKLSGVADRKAPLIAALQAELGGQQAAIAQLRSDLAAQQVDFAADSETAHAVYDAALRCIEDNSRLALSSVEGEVAALTEQSAQLSSFALVESALQSKCAQLARKNADNEAKHAQRMADMQREWDGSRAKLDEAADRARRESERRYKQQVMAAINISYSRVSDEIEAMRLHRRAEEAQLKAQDADIQAARDAIAEERAWERQEQRQRADGQRSLLDLRLQLRQVRRDVGHEQEKLEAHRRQSAQRRQRTRAEREAGQARLDGDLREWRGARSVHERGVRRVQRVVLEAEKARRCSSFQQLVEECIEDVTTPGSRTVAQLDDEERQRILRQLFVRIGEAEAERERRQQPQWQVADEQQQEEQQREQQTYDGPSFFLTQNQIEQADEQFRFGDG